jgi:uncharacterized membrane protein YkvA (DUF1232 family)
MGTVGFQMPWLHVLLPLVLGLLLVVLALSALGRWLAGREPYASFIRLPMRAKLKFFRLLATDPRVPRRVKVLPFLLAGYLASPIDLVPDFLPVLGYVDDVAIILGTLALVMRWTPRTAIDELLLVAADTG